ncbi:flagellar protein FliT [Sporolactobacillus kofuensis]|uniref:Flagellar protein FliT n=1 Tax=Sporolactobacillus kofuensis TaxID=269672 RepID=A0ABW1WG63_9BACL|nr:flagellar protein FliT [Sporolactobacillus kofuensis]MCO7176451.1 flagellar protein FliT [Sporolactobacillus kofuensis]
MSVQQIYEVTLKLKQCAEQQLSNPSIEIVKNLKTQLDLRQRLIEGLTDNYSPEEKVLGKKIVELNKEINEIMTRGKQNLIEEMNNFRHQKKSLTQYRGYNNALLNQSGSFFDRHE